MFEIFSDGAEFRLVKAKGLMNRERINVVVSTLLIFLFFSVLYFTIKQTLSVIKLVLFNAVIFVIFGVWKARSLRKTVLSITRKNECYLIDGKQYPVSGAVIALDFMEYSGDVPTGSRGILYFQIDRDDYLLAEGVGREAASQVAVAMDAFFLQPVEIRSGVAW
ncbi:hypothetical protein [Flavihumibacter petaseus]|uniref:Uncharacterized protein n=1 Tax=Flavihumibacter petaseus NBRC 106054 TaxID=1220578 RepID=A0A0E9N1C0_9BACT|nr:hypothetical protein [Flavihumibacter petaseus]GAO43543.1 hypothetical protein FPE01S_02_06480 [Flavihumibacter petaseus NBRC 106054]